MSIGTCFDYANLHSSCSGWLCAAGRERCHRRLAGAVFARV
ncbi:MAG: hypothetical protein GY832_08755 [Chloroflexi bacterium]|nr:hypothetical protein [Chloroflexota bacterium]